MYGADVPKSVTRCCSASRHSASRSGWPGLPSNSTIVVPTSRPPTRKFHIIQPVVVNQNNRSSGPAPVQGQFDFICSRTIPPCPWTIPFGSPVVPEEYENPQRVVERHRLEFERDPAWR